MGTIHPSVKIGVGVVIGDQVSIDEGCEIGAYSILEGETHIGAYNVLSSHVIMGGEPQDHKYKGGGRLTVGKRNKFREFSTIHRGHLTEKGTLIGNDNNFLTGSHVGHDCIIGNSNFIANQVLLAGHVEIGDFANFSGNAGAHQFSKIGSHVMISGLSGIRQDILPYAIVQGDPAKMIGINSIGLSRRGWPKDKIFQLKEAFRYFRNGMTPTIPNEFYDELQDFKSKSDRGIAKFKMKV